ncbi:hypothetical protein OC846_005544 [Tilletia horrida]|uniref:DUF4604 domain-containing protein n=1 Tax=Tilletia horrida TaxID=155126 RepID=A0AAN6GKA5_9BASI|nr:hypothetical protein OC846_005544 [Tilletia horrida]
MAPRQNNISYEGGSLPPFLARLHAQVQGSGSSGSTFTSSASETPRFDPHLEARRAAKRAEVEERRKKRKEKGRAGLDGDEEDEDDEFGGAQVVVLDEATDLSREQALNPSQSDSSKGSGQDPPRSNPASTSKSESIATPGLKRKAEEQGGSSMKATNKDGDAGLEALADEIAKQKKPKTDGALSKAEQKEKERKEKNKRAAKEKKKAGKGLSFDI